MSSLKFRSLPTVLLAVSLSLFLSACKEGKQLLFHAGAGQRSSLDEIKLMFEKNHPDVQINFSYKGSGYFIADITRSHEGDLFMPGEEFYLLQIAERGFIDHYDPKKDIAAYFVTVIITPKGNPKSIHSLFDLTREGVRVGLGNPKACAIGMWQEKVLKRAGILDEVRANAVMSAKCIPELGNATQHRAIDATIVWSTTAVLYLRDVEIVPIDVKYRGVIRLPVSVLNVSRQPRLAAELRNFMFTEPARRIFRKHAYVVDPGRLDGDGFCLGPGPSDELMHWLIEAAKVVKDHSLPVNEKTVGPFVEEVSRQRATK